MIRIPRKRGVILLDDEDEWVLEKYRLEITPETLPNLGPYNRVNAYNPKTRSRRALARILTDCPDDMFADHINQDALDNRRENLRIVSLDLNNANRRSANQWGYKGVLADFRNLLPSFRGRLKRNGMVYRGPVRRSPELAALDYNRMATAVWGPGVFLNDVRCVAMDPRPAQMNCLFCNAPCDCCCVCRDAPSMGMKTLFDTLSHP